MDREGQIEAILQFISEHRESYASLAVCRRALDQGLAEITGGIIEDLETKLTTATADEIAAYYSIVR
ncbi:MAG: hypothetical protein ACOYD6_06970 [Limnochordia bacterium]